MIRFGPFCLDSANRELRRGAKIVPLRPKTFSLLEHLAANPGRLLTKDELLDAVWPDTVVGDATLKGSIKEIREALGDDAAKPSYVATAHRLGYRFLPSVERPELPSRLTSFIGREHEMSEVCRLVASSRLVTLTGAGGSGKTRLALESLGNVAGEFDEGPWWVDLAQISGLGLVDQAVAAALGVREHGGQPIVDTIASAIGSRRALLVLDNCEHVVAAAASLVEMLLRACPRLTVLATSREPLAIEGETPWLVPPLSLPGDDRQHAKDPLQTEAVRLFLARSAEVRGELQPSPEDARRIARICSHLDGLPLAIELAAARLKVLSLGQIVERLDDCFALLGSGSRAARHQTLRAAMDWSHDLLSAEEQMLLRRLAVFVGPFSIAAAEAVCSAGPLDCGAILDVLSRLVDRSLVVVAERHPEARYRLLEPIRQYAGAKLREAGGKEATERRHAVHFLELVERLAPALLAAERDTARVVLAAEIGNLRAALGFAVATRESELAARLAGGLVWFWFHEGRWGEGRTWLAEVRAIAAPDLSPIALAATLFGDGLLAWTQGNYPRGRDMLERAATMAREGGDEAQLGHALHFLGVARLAAGDAGSAAPPAEEAVAIFRRLGSDAFGLAVSLASLAIIELTLQDFSKARAALEESIAICRDAGDRWALALSLRNYAIAAARQGDLERAAATLRESLDVLRDRPEKWFVSRSIESLASVLARQGRLEASARLYGAGEALREAIGAAVLPFYRLDYDAGLDALGSGLGPNELRDLWGEGRRLGLEHAIDLAIETR